MRKFLENARLVWNLKSTAENLDNLIARFGQLASDYQSLNARCEALQQNHQTLSDCNDSLREQYDALNKRHENLEKNYQALLNIQQALQQNHLATGARLQKQEDKVEALFVRRESLKEIEQTMTAREDVLRATVNEMEIRVKSWSGTSLLSHRAQAMKVARNILKSCEKTRSRSAASDELAITPFDAQRDKLRAAFPFAFPHWAALFENAREEYEERPFSSLSVEGNPGAAAFRDFLASYAHGNVLDVGCGPQPIPSYLKDISADRLVGIDPLPGGHEREFEFVQSHAEFLPWPDNEFDVVVAATSLDHVLSLEMAASEMKRVLRPGGYIVTWVGFVPGTSRYLPTDPNIVPIDQFHLFHFDKKWFLEFMREYFKFEEEFSLDIESHFYAFSKE